jgi:hypothetical protein
MTSPNAAFCRITLGLLIPYLIVRFAATAQIQGYTPGSFASVAPIQQRSEWNRFTILVWQWQNDVRQNAALYEKAGLHAFHIDHGVGKDDLVQLSLTRRFPYYVDHAAGKGILYLGSTLRPDIAGKSGLLIRPNSLSDPAMIKLLKDQLRDNISATRKGLVYGYAFDDEISLGSFNSPAEVDIHPNSVSWYHRWLQERYSTVERLNESWGANYKSFSQVEPISFEDIRHTASAPPFASWNLSRWLEWRHFMDYQFAAVLADLTRYSNTLDPGIPAGFVGGQQPSAFGGYDYGFLSRAVQWMEGEPDLLRSFWNRPRRPHVLTYNLTGSWKQDTWTLWQRLAHGDQATIAWPEGWFPGGRELSPEVKKLAPLFREIQGPASEFIVSPDAYLDTDPIGIYYSHPSIRAGWVMDAATHGSSWPKRYSSLDDENLTSGWLRRSWGTLLHDLGYQYDFINYLDVQENRFNLHDRFKVIILPQTVCLSDVESNALKDFVFAGGTLVADNLCGLLTETGKGRKKGSLDDLFGVSRDEGQGYLDGRSITEIDGEYFDQPFPNRLHAYQGAKRRGAMVIYEKGTVVTSPQRSKGDAVYLNLTPASYSYFAHRSSEMGSQWRDLLGGILRQAGLKPRVEVKGSPWIESLLWRRNGSYCLAVLKNPSSGSYASLEEGVAQLRISLSFPTGTVKNLRTGKVVGNGSTFTDTLTPYEANLYQLIPTELSYACSMVFFKN